MAAPEDYTLIPPAKVAVEASLEHNDLRFWQKRRDLADYTNFDVLDNNTVYTYFA